MSSLPTVRPLCCLVTDRHRFTGDEPDQYRETLRLVAACIRAGIDLVQVRERDLEARTLRALVSECLALARETGTRVVVNDRLDVALAAGADGVHLRSDSVPASRVRRLAPGLVLGRSVHDPDEAARATAGGGLDYVVAGTVYRTPSKPDGHPRLGLDQLRTLVQRSPVPVLAIGGVQAARLSELATTGVAGVAAIGAFHALGPDPERIGEWLATVRRAFDTVQGVS